MADGTKEKQHQPRSSFCLHVTECFQDGSPKLSCKSSSPDNLEDEKHGQRKPGNDTFERLATFGLLANFMVYLTRMLHLDQVSASNIINVWSGFTNFAPLVGAFISDAYDGRFRTIAFASFSSLLPYGVINFGGWGGGRRSS
ncbi:protein NRT1/ PTR FAMILY 2.13-like [Prunus yedoensis var. nudiflora]|uniref:Protein NRT1/ PTR FAMILY 2.13-like n=1 Tax=Prunus yedoensis var. nudiflora TaxID=2094558 RepID=A0A314YV17_PRUYE|nr:protein NRT1/ PTR FAMILY 2.13-like [Prunus yedoensis var. nudiflora]